MGLTLRNLASLLRFPIPPYPQEEGGIRQLNEWFIQARYLAVAGSALLSLMAVQALKLFEPWVLRPLLLLSLFLGITNRLYAYALQRRKPSLSFLWLQGLGDLLFLYLFFYLTGGIRNPLITLALIHVILGVILFPREQALRFTGAILLFYLLLALPDLLGIERFRSHPRFLPTLHPYGVLLLTGALGFVTILLHLFVAHLVRLARTYKDLQFQSLCLQSCPWIVPFQHLKGSGFAVLAQNLAPLWASHAFEEIRELYETEIVPELKKKLLSPILPQEGEEFPGTPLLLPEKRLFLNGETRFYSMALYPLQGGEERRSQESPAWVLFLQDITAQKIHEHQLLQEDRLKVLGLVTSGVLHEVGNPLSSLSSRVHLLSHARDPGEIQEGLKQLSQEIQRISGLVRELSLLNRARSQGERIPVRSLIEYTLEILRLHPQGKKRRFRIEGEGADLAVLGSFSELCQALLNLGMNAVEATEEGAEILIQITLTREGRVAIAVRDEGKGIPPEIEKRIFDPFFTTKQGGTGLGLFLARRIAEAHKGKLEFTSTPTGTTFTLLLPQAPPLRSPAGEGAPARASSGTG